MPRLIGYRQKAERRALRDKNPPKLLPPMRLLRGKKKTKPTQRLAILYNSKDWRMLRLSYITRNPICALCGAVATDVDHKRPHRGNVRIFFDIRNLQSLCKPCHVKKSKHEQQTKGHNAVPAARLR